MKMIVKIFTESLCGGMCHSIFLKLLFQNTNLKGKWLKERKGIDRIFKGTRLSKFIWELKDQGINFQVKWRIVDRAPPYNPRTRKCALCTKESYYINYQRHMSTLNSRFEVFGVCRHRNMECLVKHVWSCEALLKLWFLLYYLYLFKSQLLFSFSTTFTFNP